MNEYFINSLCVVDSCTRKIDETVSFHFALVGRELCENVGVHVRMVSVLQTQHLFVALIQQTVAILMITVRHGIDTWFKRYLFVINLFSHVTKYTADIETHLVQIGAMLC